MVVFSCSNATRLEHGSKHKKRCTLPSERRGVLKWQLGFYQSISRLPLSSSMDRCMDNNDLRGAQARLRTSRNTSNTDHRLRVYGVYSITFATRLLIPVRLQLDSAVAWCANHTRCHSLLPFLASMEGELFPGRRIISSVSGPPTAACMHAHMRDRTTGRAGLLPDSALALHSLQSRLICDTKPQACSYYSDQYMTVTTV
eukprot:scpid17691/ scgid12701/ 